MWWGWLSRSATAVVLARPNARSRQAHADNSGRLDRTVLACCWCGTSRARLAVMPRGCAGFPSCPCTMLTSIFRPHCPVCWAYALWKLLAWSYGTVRRSVCPGRGCPIAGRSLCRCRRIGGVDGTHSSQDLRFQGAPVRIEEQRQIRSADVQWILRNTTPGDLFVTQTPHVDVEDPAFVVMATGRRLSPCRSTFHIPMSTGTREICAGNAIWRLCRTRCPFLRLACRSRKWCQGIFPLRNGAHCEEQGR